MVHVARSVAVLMAALGFAVAPAFPQEPKVHHHSAVSRPVPTEEDRDVGLSVTGSDGISTRRVPAVPCGTAASENDGTTSCVGIPGRVTDEDPDKDVPKGGFGR